MRGLNLDGRKALVWERSVQWICIALCLGLFGLYLHALSAQPLWWDEGSSIYKALLPPAALVKLVASTDDHPPGFYLLLRGWMAILGTSAFGTRLLSVLSAVSLTPLLYATGKRLGQQGWTGVAAAAIGALLPYTLQHTREARMYTLVMALAAASTYAFLRLCAGPAKPRRWQVAYVGLAIVGLHIHYAMALLYAAQGIAILAAWGWRKTDLRPWVGMAGIVGVTYLPWLSCTWPRLQTLLTGHLGGAHGPRLNWPDLLPALQRALMGGLSPAWSTAILSLLLLGALTGMVVLFRRQRVAALYLGVGVAEAVMLVLLLQRQGVDAAGLAVRQTFFSVPLLVWLAVVGFQAWSRASRWVSLGAIGLIIFSLGENVPAFYRQPVDAAEDYRPLVAQAAAVYRPGDAVWTNYDWQEGYFDSYAPQVPFRFYSGVGSTSTVTETLESLYARHPRLWVVNYKVDVHDVVDYPFNAWLNAHALPAFESWYGNSHLALFARAPELPGIWPSQAVFEHGITLGYEPVAPGWGSGDLLVLSLRWQASAPASPPYSAFIHVRQPDAPPVAQSDYALEALAPAAVWRQGQPVVSQRAVLLPPDLAPGTFFVYAGLYDPQAPNSRLNVISPSGCDLPDSACLGKIEIVSSKDQP